MSAATDGAPTSRGENGVRVFARDGRTPKAGETAVRCAHLDDGLGGAFMAEVWKPGTAAEPAPFVSPAGEELQVSWLALCAECYAVMRDDPTGHLGGHVKLERDLELRKVS